MVKIRDTDNTDNKRQPTPKGSAALLLPGYNYHILSESDIALYTDLVSIPNKSGHEYLLTQFITKYTTDRGYYTKSDKAGNIYVTKGKIKPNEFVPLLNAHLDSVFTDHINLIKNNQSIDIVIEGDKIKGYHPVTKKQIGVGFDDKNGVFIALMLLDMVEKCKIIFTTEEEAGMKGASYSIKRKDQSFYSNIGYILALDSPDTNIFSESFYNGIIFNRESGFFKISEKIIKKHIPNLIFEPHPWTCMLQLRNHLMVQGFNCPASYFNYHRDSEYSSLSRIQTTLNMCNELINELGFKKKYELKI